MSNAAAPSFAALVQEFFTEYLVGQRALSPCTVASYRDAFTLLLGFAERRLGTSPCALSLRVFDYELIAAFLEHLEHERGNSVRTRNARLAAIHAFLKFAARRDVANLQVISQALAVPVKRFERPMVGFLTREQMLALIDAPPTTWLGDRDRLLLTMLYNTGARVSEITGVRVGDVVLAETARVHLRGKGRKERTVPLWPATATAIRAWLRRNPNLSEHSSLLPTRTGSPMTRASVAQRLKLAVHVVATQHPDLTRRSISPHSIRHTTAMHLLQAGVDITVIALWLGHESPSTTHLYVEADLAMKERALARLSEPGVTASRYQPSDALLQFLQAL